MVNYFQHYKKGKVKMKQLPVRFAEKQALQISDVAQSINATSSEVARAALAFGLTQIKELAAKDTEKAYEIVSITAHKTRF